MRETYLERLKALPLTPIVLVTLLSLLGVGMLYSAGDASFSPWGFKQLQRFTLGFVCMILIAMSDVRRLYSIAYGFYFISLLALIAVEVMGHIGMGAQRWIHLGFFTLQPSELMRISVVLALARYFHDLPHDKVNQPMQLMVPLMLVLLPTVLVLRQPDLGTAMLLLLSSAVIFFLASVHIGYFIGLGSAVLAALPILWTMLHDYQRKRVLIFINPESDPMKSGYHIIQSKIALGSAGLFGKGYLQGTQSHFDFLPEKQTDFIFTMFCEEFGFIGAMVLIAIYLVWIGYNMRVAYFAKSTFLKLTAASLSVTFFLYMFINMAMVTGLLPVVGIPLPLFSYGGTAMLTLLISQGIVMAIHQKR